MRQASALRSFPSLLDEWSCCDEAMLLPQCFLPLVETHTEWAEVKAAGMAAAEAELAQIPPHRTALE